MDTKKEEYLFHQGTNFCAQDYLGVNKEEGAFVFRVWAPNAESVFLCGDFNGWDNSFRMKRVTEGGVYEYRDRYSRVKEGDNYKYRIYNNGKEHLKADPYARLSELPPRTASVVYLPKPYVWKDSGWREHARKTRDRVKELPMNIYELHIGSWKRRENGSSLGYAECAKELAPYVKKMGYTHIELLPIMEHPFEDSWGYQVCSYFAPDVRYGEPEELKRFVDIMHGAGIGVILDWVPAHFPKDAHGLYEFDGKPLYEYQGKDRIEHETWGTRRFDVGRNEVQSFLISNALYWLNEFHFDALRVDAVASMLYLDYDRRPGEWVPNVYGDNKCLEAIAFFKKLNSAVRTYAPSALMIAEESTAWANITGFENDGLGFDLKWNMGWMNDSLEYIQKDPVYRSYHHGLITFSMTYAFSESFILPISHDEVVHSKRSLLDKCHGDYWQKFATSRLFMAYMMTHPGKKLTFMGSELGAFREWDNNSSIEWFLLDYDMHRKYKDYIAGLNAFYLENRALWELDDTWAGFEWIDADDRERSVFSYRRRDKEGNELVVILNFTPVVREDYELRVPDDRAKYREVLNSDSSEYGGSNVVNTSELSALKREDGICVLKLRLSPLGATILKKINTEPTKK